MAQSNQEELRERVTKLLWGGRTDVDGVIRLFETYRKQHELDAKIDTLETIKMLNPHSGLMQVDSYDESDSGDGYVFVTLDEKIAELKAEREGL